MQEHIRTGWIIANTAAWVLLLVSVIFNWAFVTQRIDVMGHDALTRAISESGKVK
jgi:hypothetical protein